MLNKIVKQYILISFFFYYIFQSSGILAFDSAESCKECHYEIYKLWKTSMHSQAINDPIFDLSYNKAIRKDNKMREFCLRCHSPVAVETKDLLLKSNISNEGVTCDFCHRVLDVNINKNIPEFKLTRGKEKISSIPESDVKNHPVKYSELFKNSEFCAGCHEMKSGNGVEILGTYSEWKASEYYKKNIQCQNCHMPELFNVLATKDKQKFANDHGVAGGHSVTQLKKAASVSVDCKVTGKEAIVTVFITNKESGHALPTGIPTRKLILIVELFNESNKLIAKDSKVYEKVVADKDGNILNDPADIFMNIDKIVSDNRILPKETRKEIFRFILDKSNKKIKVIAHLKYELSVPVTVSELMKVDIASSFSEVTPSGYMIRKLLKLFLLLILLIAICIFILKLAKFLYGRFKR